MRKLLPLFAMLVGLGWWTSVVVGQQVPAVEPGDRTVNSRLVNEQLELRDAATNAPICLARGQSIVDPPLNGEVRSSVTLQRQPTGADLVFTFRNMGAEPRPLTRISLGVLTLGQVVTYQCDGAKLSTPMEADYARYAAAATSYPGRLYSPACVLINGDYAVGLSVQYPLLQYKHDVSIGLRSPSSFALTRGEGGRGWVVDFGFSNSGEAAEGDRLAHEAMLAPDETRTYVVSVRVTRNTGEWVRTLLPYRNYFRALYGGVKYERSTGPVRGVELADAAQITEENLRGFAGEFRPDRNGWRGFISYLDRDLNGFDSAMLWVPGGLYDKHRENNLPFQFVSPLQESEPLATIFDAASGMPGFVRRTGKSIGYWWGQSARVARDWNPRQLVALDPANPEHTALAFNELDLAVKAGAQMIGLGGFSHENCPVWSLYPWLSQMRLRHPDVEFVTEPIACDVLHTLAATFARGWHEGAAPENPDGLFVIRNPNYLADFLLPGHELWGGFRYDGHRRFFGIGASPELVTRDMQRMAALGYRPCFIDVPDIARAAIAAAATWESTVPPELMLPATPDNFGPARSGSSRVGLSTGSRPTKDQATGGQTAQAGSTSGSTGAPTTGSTRERRVAVSGGGAPNGGGAGPGGDSTTALSATGAPSRQPPAAPSGLSVVDSGDGRSATLSWQDNSTNENWFRIVRQTRGSDGRWGPASLITVPANRTSYVDMPGVGEHQYRISARDGEDGSPFTSWRGVGVSAAAPAAPSSLIAIDSGNALEVSLLWTDNSWNETAFQIERQTRATDGSYGQTVALSAAENAYQLTDTPGVGNFRYRIAATNDIGSSAFAPWTPVLVMDVPPAQPTSLVTRDVGNERDVELTWVDASDNETGFTIERQTQGAGGVWSASVTLDASANTGNLIDSPGAGTYRYRIAAINDAGDSGYTAWATASAASGWTVFTPSADTRIVYVSSSEGNDANSGLSEDAPKRTIAAGYALLRNGYPDWLLLKRGDVWVAESFTGASAWNKSGRSETERILLGAYGDGERPVVQPVGAMNGWAAASGSTALSHIAIVGVKFFTNTWNGDASTGVSPTGLSWLRIGSDFFIEDCYFEGFANNVVVQGFPHDPGLDGFTLRRSILINPLRTDSGNTNFYSDSVRGFVIEGCLFAQTAANEAAGNKLSHNIYFNQLSHADPRNRVAANIFYNGRTNLTVRTSADIVNNLVIRGGQGIWLGYNNTPVLSTGNVSGNVIIESRNHWNGQSLGQGLGFTYVDGIECRDNLLFHSTDGLNHAGIIVQNSCHGIAFERNVAYDWKDAGSANNISALLVIEGTPPGPVQLRQNEFGQIVENWILRASGAATFTNVTFVGNQYAAARLQPFMAVGDSSYTLEQWRSQFDPSGDISPRTYPDPARTVGQYSSTVLGEAASTEAFILSAAQQSRTNWDDRKTASSVNGWLRAGFGLDPVQR